MYHTFFGLNEQAFSIAVNPRYLYMSDQHREALAHLVYGIQVGGFVMLTGEVGTGKTTIIRCLLEQLPEDTDIAIVLNPMASAPELLSVICDELGVRYVADRVTVKDLVDCLHEYLLRSHMKGRKTVLLIDEAQLLKTGVLEQIRLLTNLETTTEKLLQIILVGQPELKKLLARPSLRQLSQRITARFHLEALSLEETHAYIAHRLGVAGMPAHQNPFPPEIIKQVHEFSGGVPRLINVLCERMLLGAYGKNQRIVDKLVFQQAATEVSGEPPQTVMARVALPYWHLAVVALLLALLAGSFFLGRSSNRVEPLPIIAAAPVASSVMHISSASEKSSVRGQELETETPGVETPVIEEPVTAPLKWERDLVRAQQTLMSHLGIEAAKNPCVVTSIYSCEKAQLSTWNDLRDINRPAVLTLVTSDRKLAYAVLTGLSEERVLLLLEDRSVTLPWPELASLWNGGVYYLWRRPPGFDRPVVLGDQGRVVTWLAQQFATLDKQDEPLSRGSYNQVLKKRVEIFQASQQLKADGIVGAQTLRRLNEALGIDKPLIASEDDFQAQPAAGIE